MKNNKDSNKVVPFAYTRRPLFSLQQEINRVFSDFFFNEASLLPIDKFIINPSINIVEDKNLFKVEAEMPGIGKEDIDVSINNKMLYIRGKKKVSTKNENKNYVTREISYGSYERSIALPDYIEADKVSATFKKGMLWVTFPKKSDSSNHDQKIKVEEANFEEEKSEK